MAKEFLTALIAFSVAAIVIIILMTAAGNALYPSAVSIVETRLERGPAAETERPSTAPPAMEAPAPEIEPRPPEPAPQPATPPEPEPIQTAEAPEPPESGQPGAVPAPAEPAAPTPAESPDAGPSPLSPAAVDRMTDDLPRGEILPLADGRVAYKVQSGDTFSQICKKVIGTGRPDVWKKAAETMGIDYRAIRPGMVLIFDPSMLALGGEE